MSNTEKQRTKIEDLSPDENDLFDLSEEQMLMMGSGGYTVLCRVQTEVPVYDFIQGVCTVEIRTDEVVDEVGGGYGDDGVWV